MGRRSRRPAAPRPSSRTGARPLPVYPSEVDTEARSPAASGCPFKLCGGPHAYERKSRLDVTTEQPLLEATLKKHRSPSGGCSFCAIVAGLAPATIVRRWPDCLAIVPLSRVTPGHVLVIPHAHVADVATDPEVSAATMRRAAELSHGVGACNIITSQGRPATQTIFHLHLHIVPRRDGDGLKLPWSSGDGVEGHASAVARAQDVFSEDSGVSHALRHG
ncbi:HIT family protein [Streptomyces sp. NPDC093250]|uniref:HIT family protein n=1 Tax=Streptomyces sp. NPDC093250 TaxID=3366036 RepID=UPI0037F965F8